MICADLCFNHYGKIQEHFVVLSGKLWDLSGNDVNLGGIQGMHGWIQ